MASGNCSNPFTSNSHTNVDFLLYNKGLILCAGAFLLSLLGCIHECLCLCMFSIMMKSLSTPDQEKDGLKWNNQQHSEQLPNDPSSHKNTPRGIFLEIRTTFELFFCWILPSLPTPIPHMVYLIQLSESCSPEGQNLHNFLPRFCQLKE